MSHYWIGVVSLSHVERGVKGGFAQVCHGKRAPLQRMMPNDWLIYYSPKESLEGKVPYQAFTAIGQLVDEHIYQVEMTPNFCPFRREVHYLTASHAPIRPLLQALSFTQGRVNWGMIMRRGLFEITHADFEQIANAMHADVNPYMV